MAAGKVEVTDADGDGVGSAPDFTNITVQVDLDGTDGFEADEYVAGTFVLSNQYQTVEFVSLKPCEDVETNSCGDPMYCLPINEERNYVKYRVVIKAGILRNCNNDSNQCLGLGYENGTATEDCILMADDTTYACGNGEGVYFMKADIDSTDGIVDLTYNSLDGNKNGFTQGPQLQSGYVPYSLNNKVVASHGDDLLWDFYINNKVDLTPPVALKVGPAVRGSGSSLISPVVTTFNKLLLSSTAKPDSGYIDGKCTCTDTINCPNADQVCSNGLCVNQSSSQIYCGDNDDCKTGFGCRTKKYVTLIDNTSFPVAYWIANVGEDIKMCLNDERLYRECSTPADCGTGGICSAKDDYSDRSIVQIRHTFFLEQTQYGAEMASGLKDVYQNCFVPGKGPTIETCDPYASPTGCCLVDITATPPLPYCCNGNPSATACR